MRRWRKEQLRMPSDLQSRTQYLALAEFCQSIIAALYDYLDGATPLPTEVLQKALSALQSVKSGDPYKFGQRPTAALGSYEQVRTLEEAWRTQPQLDDVINRTLDLLNSPGGGDHAKASELIKDFSKLQARAFWNFEQPKQTAPPDVGELCRALNHA
jgi:hypothetical protein